MPGFIFWNTYRLGGGSSEEKKYIIEGTIAQLFKDSQASVVYLCEVTSDVQLGDAATGKDLYKASRTMGQLAYSAFDEDLKAHHLEQADVADFRDVFGIPSFKKGGGKFTRQSKRPVANDGTLGNTHIYIYHANASAKSAFLTAWVAEWANLETKGNFILAGDLNCNPLDFDTCLQHCAPGRAIPFKRCHGGHTHNAKKQLNNTYDWAIVGPAVQPVVTVTPMNFGGAVADMKFDDDPRSDHLPIVVSW